MATTIEEIKNAYPCPYCGAARQVPCFARKADGTRGKDLPNSQIHAGRRDQLCDEEFIEFHHELATCGKLANHRGQHATLSGNLRWSKGAQITHQRLHEILDN